MPITRLHACFQSTPKYVLNATPDGDNKGIYPIDGENLIKQLSRYSSVNVLANRGETDGGSTQFSGSSLLGTAPKDKKKDYYKFGLQFAGQWTITSPNGNVKEVGNITMDQSGNPGFPAGGPAPIKDSDQTGKIPDSNPKPQ